MASSSDDTSITKDTGTPYAAAAVAGAAIHNLIMIREVSKHAGSLAGAAIHNLIMIGRVSKHAGSVTVKVRTDPSCFLKL